MTCQACGKPATGWIDVEDRASVQGGGVPGVFRRATCCADCCERMDCDQWASRGEWESLKPLVPFEQLPELTRDFPR